MIVDNWVIPYGILTYPQTGNGPPSLLKCFASETQRLGMKKLHDSRQAPANQLPSRPVERNNHHWLPRLLCRASKRLGPVCAALAQGYNPQVYQSTGATPFPLVLSRQPLVSTTVIPDEMTTNPPQMQYFCSLYLHQLDVPQRNMDAKRATATPTTSTTLTELSDPCCNSILHNTALLTDL